MTILSPCRVVAAVALVVIILGGLGAAIWALGEIFRIDFLACILTLLM